MKQYVCDKCKNVISKEQTTKIKVRGLQNFTKHVCFDCLIKIGIS